MNEREASLSSHLMKDFVSVGLFCMNRVQKDLYGSL